MNRILAVLLLAVFASSAAAEKKEKKEEKEGRLFRAMGVATWGASATDLVVTEVGLARGLKEANPLAESRPVRFVVHATFPLILNKGTARIHKKHPKLALWMRVGIVAFYGFVSAKNIQQINRQTQ